MLSIPRFLSSNVVKYTYWLFYKFFANIVTRFICLYRYAVIHGYPIIFHEYSPVEATFDKKNFTSKYYSSFHEMYNI